VWLHKCIIELFGNSTFPEESAVNSLAKRDQDLIVIFPFRIPVYVPRLLPNFVLDTLSALRVIQPRQFRTQHDSEDAWNGRASPSARLHLRVNLTTAPLTATIFLLAITAIGRQEVYEGTIGVNDILPYDIVAYAFTLGYITKAIDAAGLLKFLTSKVMQRAQTGRRLFFYLYVVFFFLGCFFGNDPVIQMGMLFLVYMTRVTSNIVHPRAWIYTQFAVAHIASTIFVSSNTTNVIIAQAFRIGFTEYTANTVVPVIITVLTMFPFLLYIVFSNDSLIPTTLIHVRDLPEDERARQPINPLIPHSRPSLEEEDDFDEHEHFAAVNRLAEILNPFWDKLTSAVGVFLTVTTLIVLLALSAANLNDVPVVWATAPAGFVMFCWEIIFEWWNRKSTREIARRGREEVERRRVERAVRELEEHEEWMRQAERDVTTQRPNLSVAVLGKEPDTLDLQTIRAASKEPVHPQQVAQEQTPSPDLEKTTTSAVPQTRGILEIETCPSDGHHPESRANASNLDSVATNPSLAGNDTQAVKLNKAEESSQLSDEETILGRSELIAGADLESWLALERIETDMRDRINAVRTELMGRRERQTLTTLAADCFRWLQETFPSVTSVVSRMPFSLLPFAFPMFILVQSLVSTGWVTVFARGWDAWVNVTGTVGAIAGMGFVAVMICNVSQPIHCIGKRPSHKWASS